MNPDPVAPEGRWTTTVHDKRTGLPVRGCDGDALATIESLKAERDDFDSAQAEYHEAWHDAKNRAEAAERKVEAPRAALEEAYRACTQIGQGQPKMRSDRLTKATEILSAALAEAQEVER